MWSVLWLTSVWWGACFLLLPHSLGDWVVQFTLSSLGPPLKMTFIFDGISKVFLMIVVPVSSVVLLYSVRYFESEKSKKFLLTLSLFILSIVLLSLSGDLFSLMIGWDGLGLSSLCLIYFYSNWSSLGGGLTTFITNRLGDVGLILAISTSLWLGDLSGWVSWDLPISIVFLFTVGGLTNSAQVPFSAWLPQAMAAPTPVSSLVHSSTLVTGGVYVLVRFEHYLSQEVSSLLSLSSGLTIILAGMSSLSETDLNKVVALSTLVHVGLMVFLLSLGESEVALFHMLIHAYFKSLLFIAVGELIHAGGGSQDIRCLSALSLSSEVRLPLTVSLLGMVGIPFLSGFFSNEMILSSETFSSKVSSLCIILCCLVFTVAYSLRILIHVWSNPPSPLLPNFSNSMSLRLLPVWSLITVSGGVLGKNLLLLSSEDLSSENSLLLPFLFTVGGLTATLLWSKNSAFPSFLLGGKEGMWSVRMASTTTPLGVWWLSLLYSRYIDVYGVLTSLSEGCLSLGESSKEFLSGGLNFSLVSSLLLGVSILLFLVVGV